MRRGDKLKQRLRQEQHYRDNHTSVTISNPVDKVGSEYGTFLDNTLSVPILPDRQLPAVVPDSRVFVPELKPIRKTNIPLVVLAYTLAVVGIAINGWFAYSRGATDIDKFLLCSLGFIAEAIMFYLPTQTANLWRDRNIGGFVFGCFVSVALFVFAIINSLGFASVNLHETTNINAERVTPAVSDAQRRLDTLSTSRASECLKRGDKCRQLEKEEQHALESLREAREKVSATADPQVVSAAKLISWVSLGRYHPTHDDFAMLRLLLLTLLPQLGGVVLMLSFRQYPA